MYKLNITEYIHKLNVISSDISRALESIKELGGCSIMQ